MTSKNEDTPSLGERLAQKKFSNDEMGDARRFAYLFADTVRWVPERKSWYSWSDGAGCWIPEGNVKHMAMCIAEAIKTELWHEKDPERGKELALHVKKVGTNTRIHNMLSLAEGIPSLRANPDAFDRNPWILPFLNGLLDLRTGTFGPHRREELYTMVCPHRFDPEATCPEFDQYLVEALPDPKVRDFEMRYMGSCLSGVVQDEKFVINYGDGRNGKGVLDTVMHAVLGPYAWPLTINAILKKRNEIHSSVYLDLRGKRYVSVSESDEDDKLSVSQVCRLTGGDSISAARKHKDAEKYDPTHKLVCLINPLFDVVSTADAIWDRMLPVHWPINFVKVGKADPKLKQRLKENEIPGIINRLVAACLEWQELGLVPPKSVYDAVGAYRTESNVEQRFVDEACTVDSGVFTLTSELYDYYVAWCRKIGKTPKKVKGLVLALGKIKGITTGTRDGRNYATVTGIRIANQAPQRALQMVQGGKVSQGYQPELRAVGKANKVDSGVAFVDRMEPEREITLNAIHQAYRQFCMKNGLKSDSSADRLRTLIEADTKSFSVRARLGEVWIKPLYMEAESETEPDDETADGEEDADADGPQYGEGL